MFKGPIALGAVRTSSVLGLRLLVQAGTLLLVARTLGPGGFGAFAGLASLAVLLGTLSAFGTNFVLLGEVSKDPSKRDSVLAYAMPTTLLCGGGLFFIYLILAVAIMPVDSMSWQVILALGLTEIFLQPILVLFANERLGRGGTARSQLLINVPLVLRLCSAVVIMLSQFINPLLAYGYSYLLASVLALLLARLTLSIPWPSIKKWRLPELSELKHSSGYAALALSASGPTELDKTLAVKLLPAHESGLYVAASRVIGASTLPVMAMMLAALPRLFRLESESAETGRRLIMWIFSATLIFTSILAVALWCLSPALVVLFGGDYIGIDEIISLLCLAVPALGLRVASASILMSSNRPWERFFVEVVGVGVFLILSIIIVPEMGVKGISYALIVSEWLMAVAGITLIVIGRRG